MIEPKIAAYPGTFDPPHNGHENIYRQAQWFFDKIYIVIGRNGAKSGSYMLDPEERAEAWKQIIERPEDRVVIAPDGEPITDTVTKLGCTEIIRGPRTSADFHSERAFREFVKRTEAGIDLAYFMCDQEFCDVSGTVIKQLRYLDDAPRLIAPYVPTAVHGYMLAEKIYYR